MEDPFNDAMWHPHLLQVVHTWDARRQVDGAVVLEELRMEWSGISSDITQRVALTSVDVAAALRAYTSQWQWRPCTVVATGAKATDHIDTSHVQVGNTFCLFLTSDEAVVADPHRHYDSKGKPCGMLVMRMSPLDLDELVAWILFATSFHQADVTNHS